LDVFHALPEDFITYTDYASSPTDELSSLLQESDSGTSQTGEESYRSKPLETQDIHRDATQECGPNARPSDSLSWEEVNAVLCSEEQATWEGCNAGRTKMAQPKKHCRNSRRVKEEILKTDGEKTPGLQEIKV
jgi:hypothetical protein